MSLNYKKNDNQHSGDSFWTSYSDLFLGLSCIFLLLYVVSSMRQGADVIKQQVQNEQLSIEVNDLKNQLKAYEDIKNQYMKDQASQAEKNEYNELVDKLSLLKEETVSENERLKKALLANESKEQSLNKYQQMVRNMLNANKLAKVKINTREDVIEEKKQVISEKDIQVSKLESEIDKNKQLIADGERQIQEAKNQLDDQLKKLKSSYKANKITRAILEKRIKQANLDNQKRIESLMQDKKQYQDELAGVANKLKTVTSNLDETKNLLDKKSDEAEALQGKLARSAGEAEARIAGLKSSFAKQQSDDRAAFMGELNKLKLGAAERSRREAEFKAAALKKEKDLNNQMSGLQDQLEKAKAEIEARRSVAKDIKARFAGAGIKAEVDSETGEVLLDFGQSYFDNGSAALKPEMKAVIEKAIPMYAKSLLGNIKTAEKVSAVEIIGFASPTYKGKYVDPKSSNRADQEALKYNMDLSYSRAKSIFNYMVDNQVNYTADQKELMSLIKVSGRSFLEAAKVNKNVSPEDFCKVNDCKKAQRVVIRFNMDQTKK